MRDQTGEMCLFINASTNHPMPVHVHLIYLLQISATMGLP